MKTFYFDTGVRPYNFYPPVKLSKGHVIRGGTMQIPFDCENVPEGAEFTHTCDKATQDHYRDFVAEIHNSALGSRYAHFFNHSEPIR